MRSPGCKSSIAFVMRGPVIHENIAKVEMCACVAWDGWSQRTLFVWRLFTRRKRRHVVRSTGVARIPRSNKRVQGYKLSGPQELDVDLIKQQRPCCVLSVCGRNEHEVATRPLARAGICALAGPTHSISRPAIAASMRWQTKTFALRLKQRNHLIT